MLTKWYIGVNAKSKGFFTGFNNDKWTYNMEGYKGNDPKPSFTAQGALATSYDTKEDALKAVDHYITEDTKAIENMKVQIKLLEDSESRWSSMSLSEQINVCVDTHIRPDLNIVGNMFQNYLYLYPSKSVSDYKPNEVSSIVAVGTNGQIPARLKICKNDVLGYTNRIQWIKDKIKVREQEIELKFKDSERRSIKWNIRGDNDTAHSYCNCCGGAVPSIPQLNIGSGWGKSRCLICAICMGKLAEEAKIQLGKVSDDIMDNYTADRFLRDMG
jgi:hypothetical protein